jgi:4-hydroxy-3-methylbut-2-enyl diphosphate reductase
MRVEIDAQSGFCYGVIRAIQTAEVTLATEGDLFSLGEIVHNDKELERLKQKGLKVLTHDEFRQLQQVKVLIRAHGEPPDTYLRAQQQHISIVDCTCPVVLKLQQRIKASHEKVQAQNGQLVIFGKHGHAEVNGLIGQVAGDAVVVENEQQLDKVDFSRPICLFAQTTKNPAEFTRLCHTMKRRMQSGIAFEACNTICGQVAGRQPHLEKFSREHDVIVFVSGRKSSNGKVLFEACQTANPRSYMVEDAGELQAEWFVPCGSAGICGATSTPKWLMEQVAEAVSLLA